MPYAPIAAATRAEIRHALARLLESGEETVIDLRGLPLSDFDQDLPHLIRFLSL